MQVMSDYINNAYRNIETTEEFEFVRVCTSTDQNAVRTAEPGRKVDWRFATAIGTGCVSGDFGDEDAALNACPRNEGEGWN